MDCLEVRDLITSGGNQIIHNKNIMHILIVFNKSLSIQQLLYAFSFSAKKWSFYAEQRL